jgi:hypothetical protein
MPMVDGYADIFDECNLEHLETFHAIYCPGFQNHDVDHKLRKREDWTVRRFFLSRLIDYMMTKYIIVI